MPKLTFNDVMSVLNKRTLIASANSKRWGRIVLDYEPMKHQFYLYQEGDLDNVYSDFGLQMAIDRWNELVGQ